MFVAPFIWHMGTIGFRLDLSPQHGPWSVLEGQAMTIFTPSTEDKWLIMTNFLWKCWYPQIHCLIISFPIKVAIFSVGIPLPHCSKFGIGVHQLLDLLDLGHCRFHSFVAGGDSKKTAAKWEIHPTFGINLNTIWHEFLWQFLNKSQQHGFWEADFGFSSGCQAGTPGRYTSCQSLTSMCRSEPADATKPVYSAVHQKKTEKKGNWL